MKLNKRISKKEFENTLIYCNHLEYDAEAKQLYYYLDGNKKAFSPVAQATFFKTRAGWGYIKDATVLLDHTDMSVCVMWFGGQKSSRKEYTKWGWRCFFEYKEWVGAA